MIIFLDDLWAHLAKASGKPVAMVMSTWTKQMGFPVLSVNGKQVTIKLFVYKYFVTKTILFPPS